MNRMTRTYRPTPHALVLSRPPFFSGQTSPSLQHTMIGRTAIAGVYPNTATPIAPAAASPSNSTPVFTSEAGPFPPHPFGAYTCPL